MGSNEGDAPVQLEPLTIAGERLKRPRAPTGRRHCSDCGRPILTYRHDGKGCKVKRCVECVAAEFNYKIGAAPLPEKKQFH